jgi:hypothetical protein
MAHPHGQSALIRSTWRAAGVILLAAVLAAAGACNRGTPPPPPGPSQQQAAGLPAGASPLGYCAVTVTGAQATTFTVPVDDGDFDTDYWRTEAETRDQIRALLRFDEYQVFTEDEEYLAEQAMARDPRLTLFVMDCSGEQGGVTLVPGRFSRYADVPFRPRTYEIAPARRIEAVTAGAFYATVLVGAGQKARDYTVTAPGELNITTFN